MPELGSAVEEIEWM